MRLASLVLVLAACGDDPKLPVAKLEDPATCLECHKHHHDEWAGSMHAYASDDPVFVAMNKRGQRETGNQLGTFCVQCHAPMAVALGLTDGTSFDPAQLPPEARGITCYFCHNVKEVADDHNNGIKLALDDTMRGGVHDPGAVDTPAHHSTYDKLMDGYTNESKICGSCHDVTTPRGVALERTYAEWRTTVFPDGVPSETCSGCHMKSDTTTSVIADKPGLNVASRERSFHEHYWPGVDQALTPWPGMDDQAMVIQRDLDAAVAIAGPVPPGDPAGEKGGICVTPENTGQIKVRMDTRNVGHMWPSGAAQDRRAWLEVIAYDVNNTPIWSSGTVADDQDPEELADPSLFGMWDRTFKDDAMTMPAHFFWDVVNVQSTTLLNPPIMPMVDHSTTKTFIIGPKYAQIDHVAARIRIRPFAFAIVKDLIASGDLDPGVLAQIKTIDLAGTVRHWIKANADPGSLCDRSPYE